MSTYSKLHRVLSIPEDYYLAPSKRREPSEPPAPFVSRFQRDYASRKLIAAGEIESDSTEHVLDAICRKFADR